MLKFAILLLAVASAYADVMDPNFVDGRTVIVHLFEWRWTDIAEECENFLGRYGFAGVQVSPPMGHREYGEYGYPWWQRYQPVNYTLESRSGTEQEFQDMVSRCNAVGVRIYVDAVINHMAAPLSGQESEMYKFDAVPYDEADFNVPNGHCTTASGNIENYLNADEVRYCNLLSLPDLDHHTEDVEENIEEYLNRLLGYGVAGFRIDAAKHMAVDEIEHLSWHITDCSFGGRPYFYQEVIDTTSAEPIRASHYIDNGDVTEFKYCEEIAKLGRGERDLTDFKDLEQDPDLQLLPSASAVVFVDNHDNQRGHGAGGQILNFASPVEYTKATALTLAWNYGTKRIMSSYAFENTDQGPPSDGNGNTISPTFNSDLSCTGDWICEHRWRAMRNMACFSNVAGTAQVENWSDNGSNFISFSRGSKAFFALSNEPGELCYTRPTGLPAGNYCDLISGEPTTTGCSGATVTVGSDGSAYICLSPDNPMVAFTANSTPRSSYTGCQW